MRIAIASCAVPFIRGGAELLNANLLDALKAAGHEAEMVTLPFRFAPPSAVLREMDMWAGEDFTRFDAGPIDLVIATKFPAFYLNHPNKVTWLMHQHRAVYELWGTPFGEDANNPESAALRERIIARDTAHLRECRALYTISERVSERMQIFNGVQSRAILHPPPSAGAFRCEEIWPYILVPSRLETLKRQELAIRALEHSGPNVQLVILGDGGKRSDLHQLVNTMGLSDRVHFAGHAPRDRMLSWYAHALGVFFGPFDEDYGYITLEAMLSGKPVVTCEDSGGPLSFVVNGETGFVVAPEPEAVGAAFEALHADWGRAFQLGQAGLAHYHSLGLSWDTVVATLTRGS